MRFLALTLLLLASLTFSGCGSRSKGSERQDTRGKALASIASKVTGRLIQCSFSAAESPTGLINIDGAKVRVFFPDQTGKYEASHSYSLDATGNDAGLELDPVSTDQVLKASLVIETPSADANGESAGAVTRLVRTLTLDLVAGTGSFVGQNPAPKPETKQTLQNCKSIK